MSFPACMLLLNPDKRKKKQKRDSLWRCFIYFNFVIIFFTDISLLDLNKAQAKLTEDMHSLFEATDGMYQVTNATLKTVLNFIEFQFLLLQYLWSFSNVDDAGCVIFYFITL